jgi:hypothetical protein
MIGYCLEEAGVRSKEAGEGRINSRRVGKNQQDNIAFQETTIAHQKCHRSTILNYVLSDAHPTGYLMLLVITLLFPFTYTNDQ